MGIHSSLKRADKLAAQKSVLTRLERFKYLLGKGVSLEEIPPFGLPKIKVVKVKTSKKSAKEEKKEEGIKEEGKKE